MLVIKIQVVSEHYIMRCPFHFDVLSLFYSLMNTHYLQLIGTGVDRLTIKVIYMPICGYISDCLYSIFILY